MRVLVIGHSYVVDVNRGKLRALARARDDVSVTVVVPRRWRPTATSGEIVSRPLREGRFAVEPISALPRRHQGLLAFGPGLASLLRRYRPRVIQVEQGAKSLAYLQCLLLDRLLRLGASRLFFTWWNLPYRPRFPTSVLERAALRHSDGVVAGNRDAGEILRQHGYRGPLRVIPQLGVDDTLFHPGAEPGLAARLGIEAGDLAIAYVGRLVPEKGVLTLLRALPELGDRRWRLLVVGSGPLEEEMRRLAADLGIAERLAWAGPIPHVDVPRYLRCCRALVLPSESAPGFRTLTARGWKEQFGHVLIEAMACGLAVVGSDSGEIPQVIGDAGSIFPEGDAAALADRLARLHDDPDLLSDHARRGRERCLGLYTDERLARRQLSFYDELAGARTEGVGRR